MAQGDDEPMSAEGTLFRAFPILMLVAAVLLIVTGRSGPRPRPVFTWAGLGVVSVYIVIWMINGKRTPPLFGVLATLCAYYASRGKRPSKPVLLATAVAGVMVVSLAIGFRGQQELRAQPLGLPRVRLRIRPELDARQSESEAAVRR